MKGVEKDAALYINGKGEYKPIGAREVWLRQCSPGNTTDWKHKEYYSFHPGEDKLRMHHKMRKKGKGTHWFAFNPHQEDDYKRLGGGESLCHYLVKKAFLEIEETTLKIKGTEISYKLVLNNPTDEKPIVNGQSKIYIDVFSDFTSESILSQKWEGKIGIEVFHKHKVPDDKIGVLEELEIPVVEFKIPEYMVKRAPEEFSSNDYVNRQYINYLKPKLSNYIWVSVLSNPSTKEYLVIKNEELVDNIKLMKAENDSLANEIKNLGTQCTDFKNQLDYQRNETSKCQKLNNEKNYQLNKFYNMSAHRFVINRMFEKIGRLIGCNKDSRIFRNIIGFMIFVGFWGLMWLVAPNLTDITASESWLAVRSPYYVIDAMLRPSIELSEFRILWLITGFTFWVIAIFIFLYKIPILYTNIYDK